jgi:hypothetical protein
MSEQHAHRLAWGSIALTCLTGAAGITAYLSASHRTAFTVLAWLLLLGAVYAFYRAFHDTPRFLWFREKLRLWRRERMRQRELGRWQTAKKLEIVVRKYKGDHIVLEPMFSTSSPVPGPTWTVLQAGLAEVEITNRYMRPIEIDRLWVGIFDAPTAREIPPSKTRESKVILEGDPRIEAQSVRRYRLRAYLHYDGVIRRNGIDVFVIAESVGIGFQRTRLDDSFFC